MLSSLSFIFDKVQSYQGKLNILTNRTTALKMCLIFNTSRFGQFVIGWFLISWSLIGWLKIGHLRQPYMGCHKMLVYIAN